MIFPIWRNCSSFDYSSYKTEFVPTYKIRAWGGRRLEQGTHPLVTSINEYLKEKNYNYEKSALRKFAASLYPLDACRALSLSPEDAPRLVGVSALAARFPWEPFTPFKSQVRYMLTLKKELNIFHFPGLPLSTFVERRGKAEFYRIIKIFREISDFGFSSKISSGSPILGEVLEDDKGNNVVLIRNGEHRVSVLKCLGLPEIPIFLNKKKTVKKRNIEDWAQVKHSVLSKKAASIVFDKIIFGSADSPLVNVVGWP